MKILTAYFSRRGLNYAAGSIVDLPVGNTEAAAKMIAELTGCDLYEIERAEPYSKEYRGCPSRAQDRAAGHFSIRRRHPRISQLVRHDADAGVDLP